MRRSSMIFTLAILALAACGSVDIDSKYLDREVTIDGNHSDWDGAITYMEKENVSLGVQNDQDYLYVCLITSDRTLRFQLMRMGFTIWFDVDGGKDKDLGIRFPLGRIGAGPPPRKGADEMDRRMREDFRHANLAELEILRPGAEGPQRMSISALEGLEVASRIDRKSDMFVYELKVPLRKSDTDAFALGVDAGKMIGIGLETPEIDRVVMRRKMVEGRRPGGGMGGRGGMRGGRHGGGMRPGGEGPPEPLKVWVKVQLATN